MINNLLRQDVELRAKSAENEQQIGNIIFSALRERGIAWQQIDRDGMKQLVVDAVRAFRSANATMASSAARARPLRGVEHCCA